MSGFVKASKQMARAKIAMIGPSGAGKTFSALRCARGLTKNGRVGVLDSENNSASLYSDKFEGWEYFVLPVTPPYTARKYLDAIDLAVREKLDCLIIDSLTHVWAGEGGLLQQKEALDSRAGSNSYTNWQQITKVHEALKSKILYSPLHIITTMRSKQEYVMETNDRGKSVPKKVGLKPIQRDDLEYEFTVVFDIGMDHQFMVSKDRTDLFDGMVAKVTEQTGSDIRAWLADEIQTPEVAIEPAPEPVAPKAPPKQQATKPSPAAARAQTVPPTTAAPQEVSPAAEMPGPEVQPPPSTPGLPQLSQSELDALKDGRGVIAVTDITQAMAAKERAQVEQRRQIKNHATGEMVPAPDAKPEAKIDSAEYVIKCGKNWGMVGKKVIEINPSTLRAALAQANDMLDRGGVIDQNVRDFVFHAATFLKEMEAV